jgi:hypothetical protein
VIFYAFYRWTLKTGKRVSSSTNRWQSHMDFNGRVVGVLAGCTELFIFPVFLVRISVKFRKVPRENETDAKRGWLVILSYSTSFNLSGFFYLCWVAFYQRKNTALLCCVLLYSGATATSGPRVPHSRGSFIIHNDAPKSGGQLLDE